MFSDVEGKIQTTTYLLNSLGILQDVESSFQKNLRGYRCARLLEEKPLSIRRTKVCKKNIEDELRFQACNRF